MRVASVYSESLLSTGVGAYFTVLDEDGKLCYYPTSMDAGAYCLGEGMYSNSIEVEVTGGMLNFGIRCQDWQYSNWCMMDNFRLEYYGELIPVSSIALSHSYLSLISGESVGLEATVGPSSATYRNVTWHSDNPYVADVDGRGVVTAFQCGSATIYAEATDGSGLSASCKVTVTSSTPTAESIVINEIQSANIDMFVDPSFNYGGWVELYNPTNKAVSLNNLYVSDDATNLTKYNLGRDRGIIPAKGFHVLWLDHSNDQFPAQIDFKLDYDGGTFYISDAAGNLIVSQDYPEAIARTSYARTGDGGSSWGYTAYPSPGKSNAASIFATERVEAPIVDRDACLFASSFSFNVQIPLGATLRYTTDGTTPTLINGYTSEDGSFEVSSTSIYRFRLFEEGIY